MRISRSGIRAVALALSILPAALVANTAGVKEVPSIEFGNLGTSVTQNVESAGYEISVQKSDPVVPSRADGLLETVALNPEAILKPLDSDDDFLHDGPRSKMRKWFLTVLLLGGIIRYLSSDTFRKFVSETLDPLNW
jgi:hypothetical protein